MESGLSGTDEPMTKGVESGTGEKKAPRLDESTFPKRAAWLRERLDEREWSKHDLNAQRGPDHKTIQKILNGKQVQGLVIERTVRALNKHPRAARVAISSVPND